MMRFEKFAWLFLGIMLLMSYRQVFATIHPPEEPVSDVRILIDVSGSMKKNDPNNLRGPALRMLAGLMLEGAKSGVWTFAKSVNMLVPIREVNEEWRIEAEHRSNQIHSYGLFTNIEQVLNKATASYKTVDPTALRSVILLSDGFVDIAAGEEASQKSRQRILDNIIPRLKKHNISVHTIALSDKADHGLLRNISIATDGWYEQVDTADELQRVFLHMFEKAVNRETVPLNENNFKVDDNVTEMTLLVFHRAGTPPTELVLPDQSRLSNENLTGSVRWRHEDNYDLVTIDEPLAGNWKIEAEIDPDNRVMVVTDLKLKITDLPNNILIGETFDLEASLTEKDQVIVREDFLNLVDAIVAEENEIDYPTETLINESLQQGVYQSHLGETFKPGRNDVIITMKSATFERQRRQSINVIDNPFSVDEEQLTDQETRTHRITMRPDTDLITTEGLSVAAMLTAADGSEWSYDVMKNNELEWQLTLADLIPNEDYSLALQIKAETIKGRSVFLQPEPVMLFDKNVPASEEIESLSPVEEVPRETMMEEKVESEVERLQEQVEEEIEQVQQALEEDEEKNVMVTTGYEGIMQVPEESEIELTEAEDTQATSPLNILMAGNVIIFLVIGIGVFMWRRQSTAITNPGDEL